MTQVEYHVYSMGGFGNHLQNYAIAAVYSHYLPGGVFIHTNAIANDDNVKRDDTRTALMKIAKQSASNSFSQDHPNFDNIHIHSMHDYFTWKERILTNSIHTPTMFHIHPLLQMSEVHAYKKQILDSLNVQTQTRESDITVAPTDVNERL